MKKLISVIAALVLLFALGPPALADYDPEADYLSIMLRAAVAGDIEAGRAAAICRNERIDDERSGETKLDFDELYLLAKIICVEAGSPQLSDEWRMCVGEVVLNRVASPEFPDSICEVVFEPGQYQEVESFEFIYMLTPTEECVDAARRLLLQNRRFNAAFHIVGGGFDGVGLRVVDVFAGVAQKQVAYGRNAQLFKLFGKGRAYPF